nr:N-succinylarginine dihydrolase [Pseudoalteromonas sp. S186]
MFNNESYFTHHTHVPDQGFFGDDGAAIHTRFCGSHGAQGLGMFVFGACAFSCQ